jgi:hypothetical protein
MASTVSVNDSTPMQTNGIPGASTGLNTAMNPSAIPQSSQGTASAQQISLEGLNAGPGALFPIGPAASTQSIQSGQLPQGSAGFPGPNGSSGPAGDASGGLRMGNIASPGTNSLINGAMYGQPQHSLPAQEWMLQQQQQMQQQQMQQQQMQRHGSLPQNSGISRPESVSAAWPSARPPEVNPLEVYDRQLQQLDNNYNSALQQMDRQNQQVPPRAQY